MLPDKKVRKFLQRQASRICAYMRIRPLMLSILVLPLVLLSTMGVAKIVKKDALLTASAMNLDTDAADRQFEAGQPDGDPLAPDANRFEQDWFGPAGRVYEGNMLKFAYPANWLLDSTLIKQSDTYYRLKQETGGAVISIALASDATGPAEENVSQNAYVSEYLVDGFRGNTAYQRYFLRQMIPVHISGTLVSQVQYAAVTSELLSDEGLKSERGVKTAFLLPDDQIVTINLQTSYDNSYGNYLQVDALKPILYDIIGSILSARNV